MANTFLGALVILVNVLSGSPSAAIPAPITLDDYDFIPPDGWQVQRRGDHLRIQNMESGCLILLLEPQLSSGNLEQDAAAVFETMYKGWQFQMAGPQRFVLSRGSLPKGMPFSMVEARMGKLNADSTRYDGFEDGVALVIGSGNQFAIVAVRHSDLPGHIACGRYDTWRRFFNSFTLKNAPMAKAADDQADRIVGLWTASEAGAVGEYVFAAIGNYAYGGALGATTSTTGYDFTQLHLKTYDFQGDGSYSVSGSRLTMRRRGAQAEQATIRFEQVNRGGTGWTDRLCMLKIAVDNGKEYEACYGRQNR